MSSLFFPVTVGSARDPHRGRSYEASRPSEADRKNGKNEAKPSHTPCRATWGIRVLSIPVESTLFELE